MTDDPFAKLFTPVDAQPYYGLIADTLYPFIRFVDAGGGVQLTDRGACLTARLKVLIGVLIRKVEFARGTADEDAISPAELESMIGVQGDTVRPALLRLEADELIAHARLGYYTVPNGRIRKVCTMIGGAK
jgi:hypothetical protein